MNPQVPKHFEKYVRSSGYIELLIYPHGNGYPIEHRRMNTAPKALAWIAHLCEKNNVTTEHIAAFVEMAVALGAKIQRMA